MRSKVGYCGVFTPGGGLKKNLDYPLTTNDPRLEFD